MRSFGAIILAAAFACSTDAFTTQNTLGRPSLMTLGATETATETAISMASIRKDIAQLTADNFDATLKKVEPFLLNDAGVTFHAKCLKRIKVQAGALGATMPADYAKEAKATEKRRNKQKAFVEAKIEETEAAAAEAAAAEAAEAPAAEEESSEAEEAPAAE
jgi:hypothetical protein